MSKPIAYEPSEEIEPDPIAEAKSHLKDAVEAHSAGCQASFAQVAQAYLLLDIADTLREMLNRGIKVDEL